MKPFRKCATRRKGGYSTFNGWVKEEETEARRTCEVRGKPRRISECKNIVGSANN